MATQRISARQPSGEVIVLEVTPETTGKELKQQIKERKRWGELTRSTTGVEVIVGDNQLLGNDATVLEAGIAEDVETGIRLDTACRRSSGECHSQGVDGPRRGGDIEHGSHAKAAEMAPVRAIRNDIRRQYREYSSRTQEQSCSASRHWQPGVS